MVILALFAGLVEFGAEWLAPSATGAERGVRINLSLWSLPEYAFMSFTRGLMAYAISLIFSLIVGGIAAHNRFAERIIIPALDILQGIPVLGFMPGLVIAMASIFPHSNIGLEFACILMIFTAQAWNLAFAFYGSTRAVPSEFREVAKIHQFGWWKTFKTVELPYAAIPLAWNSMMSMAGGWFFLTVNESFRLGTHDYRLQGIGSYMSLAIEEGNKPAMFAAVAAMFIVIIISDRLIWNPISVWSVRFRLDDSLKAPLSSPVIRFLQKSLALRKIRALIATKPKEDESRSLDKKSALSPIPQSTLKSAKSLFKHAMPYLRGVIGLFFVGLFIWGMAKVSIMTLKVQTAEWIEIAISLGLTFLRTTACLVLSIAWALPAGIMIGRNEKLSQRIQPVVQLMASFPAPMLYPLVLALILASGINFQWGCTLLMLLGAQWYVLFNVIAGAQSIPSDLREVSTIYRMTKFDRWTKLYIPAVVPSLLTGLVTAAGGAWNASIISEFIRYNGETLSARGLGSLITKATETGNMPLLCASVGVMAAFIVLINRMVWKPLFKYSDQRYAMNR
jgi:NitT/TauT family transport system permease protein